MDDYSGGYYPLAKPDLIYERKEGSLSPPSNIINRFRSLFLQPPDFDDFNQPEPSLSSNKALDIRNNVECSNTSFLDMTTSSNTMAHRLLDVKRILTNLATPSNSVNQTKTQKPANHSHIDPDVPVNSAAGFFVSQSRSISSALIIGNTPPLTPDSCSGLVPSPPITSLPSEGLGHSQHQEPRQRQYQKSQETGLHVHEEETTQRIQEQSHSHAIKKGKRPECPAVRGFYTGTRAER